MVVDLMVRMIVGPLAEVEIDKREVESGIKMEVEVGWMLVAWRMEAVPWMEVLYTVE